MRRFSFLADRPLVALVSRFLSLERVVCPNSSYRPAATGTGDAFILLFGRLFGFGLLTDRWWRGLGIILLLAGLLFKYQPAVSGTGEALVVPTCLQVELI